jgi:hypothetical protein
MKALAKWILHRLPTPVVYHANRAFHALKGDTRGQADRTFLASWPQPLRVMTGPFKGLLFPREAYASAIVPCVLGVYEKELHGVVETLCVRSADLIVDIGAGEGYYSIGMALRNPQARHVAFEMFKPARHILNRTAAANGITMRFEARGACTVPELRKVLAGARNAVIICDCEGAEDLLLDPMAVPELQRAAILVELHDHFCPGVSARIRERFAPTHRVEQFDTVERTAGDVPPGVRMTDAQIAELLSEHRGIEQSWFFLDPHHPQP